MKQEIIKGYVDVRCEMPTYTINIPSQRQKSYNFLWDLRTMTLEYNDALRIYKSQNYILELKLENDIVLTGKRAGFLSKGNK